MSLTIRILNRMLDRLPSDKKAEMMAIMVHSIISEIEAHNDEVANNYQLFASKVDNFNQRSVVKKLEIEFTEEQLTESENSLKTEAEHLVKIAIHKQEAMKAHTELCDIKAPLPLLTTLLHDIMSSADIVGSQTKNLSRLNDFEFYKGLMIQYVASDKTLMSTMFKNTITYPAILSLILGTGLSVASGTIWLAFANNFSGFIAVTLTGLIINFIFSLLLVSGLFAYRTLYKMRLIVPSIGNKAVYLLGAQTSPVESNKDVCEIYRPFLNEVVGLSILEEEVCTHEGANRSVETVMKYVRRFDENVKSHITGTLVGLNDILPVNATYVQPSFTDTASSTKEIDARIRQIELNADSFKIKLHAERNRIALLEFPSPEKLVEKDREVKVECGFLGRSHKEVIGELYEDIVRRRTISASFSTVMLDDSVTEDEEDGDYDSTFDELEEEEEECDSEYWPSRSRIERKTLARTKAITKVTSRRLDSFRRKAVSQPSNDRSTPNPFHLKSIEEFDQKYLVDGVLSSTRYESHLYGIVECGEDYPFYNTRLCLTDAEVYLMHKEALKYDDIRKSPLFEREMLLRSAIIDIKQFSLADSFERDKVAETLTKAVNLFRDRGIESSEIVGLVVVGEFCPMDTTKLMVSKTEIKEWHKFGLEEIGGCSNILFERELSRRSFYLTNKKDKQAVEDNSGEIRNLLNTAQLVMLSGKHPF